MKKKFYLIIFASALVFGQKTENRNLTSPFKDTNYISGVFSSVLDKKRDTFQIVKDQESGKYALLYEENAYTTAGANNEPEKSNNQNISRSVIFNNIDEIRELGKEIENSIKNNIDKKTVTISDNKISINYTKIPLVPGTLALAFDYNEKKSLTFGLSKNRWKDFFAEIK
ncbi:hypothetical protein [Elizabethkingia anophelis]|uniref:hypothetical protein n=1 Tax=Elizabethkingia anophelis TaxID=1117645 RepID=UPI0038917B7F